MSDWLKHDWFCQGPVEAARALIGAELRWDGCAGLIVETEAYAAVGDEACHTFHRPSARAFVADNPPGTAYVYFNYGMYWLFNVLVKSARDEDEGFVLVRALEPLRGVEEMSKRRMGFKGTRKTAIRAESLCAGPGRLTVALGINGSHHGLDLCSDADRALYSPHAVPSVEVCRRIGISKAADKPWRFLLKDSRCVSARRMEN